MLAVKQLSELFMERQLKCAVAESCTGGLLAARLTEIPGSSQWFECGFVTYSNESKVSMLSVPMILIKQHGAVSEPVAMAMAKGVCEHAKTNLSVAITGIAGPGGGSIEKPVGTVWIAWAYGIKHMTTHCFYFQGDRLQIREQAVSAAIEGLISLLRRESLRK